MAMWIPGIGPPEDRPVVTPGIGVGVAGCMDFTVPVGCAAVGVLDVGTAVDAVGDGVTDGVAEDARDEE